MQNGVYGSGQDKKIFFRKTLKINESHQKIFSKYFFFLYPRSYAGVKFFKMFQNFSGDRTRSYKVENHGKNNVLSHRK